MGSAMLPAVVWQARHSSMLQASHSTSTSTRCSAHLWQQVVQQAGLPPRLVQPQVESGAVVKGAGAVAGAGPDLVEGHLGGEGQSREVEGTACAGKPWRRQNTSQHASAERARTTPASHTCLSAVPSAAAGGSPH